MTIDRQEELPAVAGVLVVSDQGPQRFLIGQRRATRDLTFPGGGIEGGETPEEAATRELFEETGLSPKWRDDIAPISKSPLILHENGRIRRLYLFWGFRQAFSPEEVTLREPTKHKSWREISRKRVRGLIRRGLLPNFFTEDLVEALKHQDD